MLLAPLAVLALSAAAPTSPRPRRFDALGLSSHVAAAVGAGFELYEDVEEIGHGHGMALLCVSKLAREINKYPAKADTRARIAELETALREKAEESEGLEVVVKRRERQFALLMATIGDLKSEIAEEGEATAAGAAEGEGDGTASGDAMDET